MSSSVDPRVLVLHSTSSATCILSQASVTCGVKRTSRRSQEDDDKERGEKDEKYTVCYIERIVTYYMVVYNSLLFLVVVG